MFKIAIGDIVQVPVKFTQKDGALIRQFAFTLTGHRANWEEYKDAHEGEPIMDTARAFLKENVTDWSGQRYVLLENNEPAPFSEEAFDHMLKQYNMVGVLVKAYAAECGSKEKN